MLLGIYFFLRIRTVATAIAMIMAIAVIAKYMSMSELETDDCAELETDDCAVEVGVGELVGVDAMLTVAR